MKDQEKTKKQLITELALLRQRVAESEKARGASTDVAELRHRAEEQLTAKQTETDQTPDGNHGEARPPTPGPPD